jgi:hypothetical protein
MVFLLITLLSLQAIASRTTEISPKLQVLGCFVFGLVLSAAMTSTSPARSADTEYRFDGWYFTAEQVEAAYQYQENYGERLRFALPAGECLMGKQEFVAPYRRAETVLPCGFILETTRHLKEMLSLGAAKYLFPLDADHAHLGIPTDLWNEKYKHRRPEEIFPTILRETGLVALYHTAEHLKLDAGKNGMVDKEATAWREKRNVLGFFDGRPTEILPPHPKGHGVGMPEGYESYGGFTFLASPRGELFLFSGQKVVTFDIALDASGADDSNASNHNASTKKNMVRISPSPGGKKK